MNASHHLLDRLLKAAAQAPSTLPVEAPFGFTARLLAQWPAERVDSELIAVLGLFRKSLVWAAVLMLAAFLASLGPLEDNGADELDLSNATFNVSWMR